MSTQAKPRFVFLLITMLVMMCFHMGTAKTYLTNDFRGTFACGEGASISYISIDPQDDAFYLIIQSSNNYIKGTFKKCPNNEYYFVCDQNINQKILKNQKIDYHNMTFKININGHIMSFKKTEQIPIIIGDLSWYS